MDINKVLADAQRLMLDENFNKQVESHARQSQGKPVLDNAIGNTSNFNMQEALSQPKTIQVLSNDEHKKEEAFNTNLSKLPKVLQESFKKQKPLTGESMESKIIAEVQKNLVVEDVPAQSSAQFVNSSQVAPSINPQIDYSLIKTIIDESVKRNLEEMKKTMLNESVTTPTFRGMKIADGNKIQFLDSKGNLYEGVLKLKKKRQ